MNDSVTFIVDAFNRVALPTQSAYPSIAPSGATGIPSLATKTVSTPTATATSTTGNYGRSNAVPVWLLAGVCIFGVMFL
jgi:hypothetical protein